ncbi:MAG: O-antigen ligase family protein [Pirellula sp.]
MASSPWFFGSVGWNEQRLLLAGGMVMAVLLGIVVIRNWNRGQADWKPNAIVWALLGLGCFSLLQSQTRYPWTGPGSVPPSVAMQRWALGLGEAPTAIREGLIEVPSHGNAETELPCGLQAIDQSERRLAISLEPQTTRGAAGNLFLAGILAWVAGCVFRRREHFPILLASVTLTGCFVGLYGLIGAATPRTANLLGLTYGTSFSVFVSKNSAGAFLNTAIAAALGMLLWSMYRLPPSKSRKNLRTDVELPWKVQAAEALQKWLARLDLAQLVSIGALLILGLALVFSLCRGAALSAVAGLVGAVWLAMPGKRSMGLAAAVLIAMVIALLVMVGLQLDERVLSRLESIGELDLESEVRGGRLYIWGVSAEAAKVYGWLGSGLGTFHFASLPFQRPTFNGWFYHAESLFAEIWVTLGHLGLIWALLACGICFVLVSRIYVSERFRDFAPLQVSAAYLLISQTLHSAVDFAMILPGVYVPTVLILGAAAGGSEESHRLIAWLRQKRRASSHSDAFSQSHPISKSRPAQANPMTTYVSVAAILLSLGCMAYCYPALRDLGIAYRIEKELENDSREPLAKRMANRVEYVTRRLAELDGSLDATAGMARILGDAISYDVRHQQWSRRSLSADAQQSWNQTSPLLTRIAMDRLEGSERDDAIQSLGGQIAIDTYERASFWYARGQSQSPLDWKLILGRATTSFQCPSSDIASMTAVIQRTAAHLPQTLTSASILASKTLDREELMKFWTIAIRTQPASAIEVGKVMATMYRDDEVPVDFFPKSAPVLRRLASEVFTAVDFPNTHRQLRELTVETSADLRWPTLKKSLWIADVAREAGKTQLEIDYLRICLQFQPNDAKLLERLSDRLIAEGDVVGAREAIRSLERAEPGNEQVQRTAQQLYGRLNALP